MITRRFSSLIKRRPLWIGIAMAHEGSEIGLIQQPLSIYPRSRIPCHCLWPSIPPYLQYALQKPSAACSTTVAKYTYLSRVTSHIKYITLHPSQGVHVLSFHRHVRLYKSWTINTEWNQQRSISYAESVTIKNWASTSPLWRRAHWVTVELRCEDCWHPAYDNMKIQNNNQMTAQKMWWHSPQNQDPIFLPIVSIWDVYKPCSLADWAWVTFLNRQSLELINFQIRKVEPSLPCPSGA